MKRCRSCGGVYNDRQADGSLYFHSCAPLTIVTVERAGVEMEVPLAGVQATDLVFVRRAGVETKVSRAQLQADDVPLKRRQEERPDRRDENVEVRGVDRDGRTMTRAKANGAGVEDVP